MKGGEGSEGVVTGLAPCDYCPTKTWCSENNEACKDFLIWVDTGVEFINNREPNKAIYRELFCK